MRKTSILTDAQKQLAKVNGQLAAHKPFINGEKQSELAVKMKRTQRTIETYMSGNGKDMHFAIDLLEAVREVRSNLISKISNN